MMTKKVIMNTSGMITQRSTCQRKMVITVCKIVVVQKIQNALNDHAKPLKNSKVLVFGTSYKRDIDDVRESPALDILLLLERQGAVISYTDPHVPSIKFGDRTLHSVAPEEAANADCVVIVTDHTAFDYKKLVKEAKLIVDSRNALKGVKSEKIVRL